MLDLSCSRLEPQVFQTKSCHHLAHGICWLPSLAGFDENDDMVVSFYYETST